MHDKRKKRVKITQNVMINHKLAAEGLDLSEAGIYIYTKYNFIQGSIIEVSFELGHERVDVFGVVQHAQHGIGVGVEFIGLTKEIKGKIKKYIADKETVRKMKDNISKRSASQGK